MEAQRTPCDESQFLPIRNAPDLPNNFSRRESPPLLLPKSLQPNRPTTDILECNIPLLPFEEGSKIYTKKDKDAIRNFVVRRRKEHVYPNQKHHYSKQESPISSTGYAAVNPKYLFRPI